VKGGRQDAARNLISLGVSKPFSSRLLLPYKARKSGYAPLFPYKALLSKSPFGTEASEEMRRKNEAAGQV
jgi:hypothetical protein